MINLIEFERENYTDNKNPVFNLIRTKGNTDEVFSMFLDGTIAINNTEIMETNHFMIGYFERNVGGAIIGEWEDIMEEHGTYSDDLCDYEMDNYAKRFDCEV